MTQPHDAIGRADDDLPALLTAQQVADLCGRQTDCWVYGRLATDAEFPRAVNGRTGPGGAKMLWRRADILAWIDLDARRKKDGQGRRCEVERLHNETARYFIMGRFDPDYRLEEQQERIAKAQRNGVKNNKPIRTPYNQEWL